MRAELVKRHSNYSEYKIKYKKEYVHFLVDNKYHNAVESLDNIHVSKTKFKDINDIKSNITSLRLYCKDKNSHSFIKTIKKEKSNKSYYLKDTYTNKNKYLLDYRMANITDKSSEVYGYSNIPKYHYEKQDKEYLVSCMREKRYSKNYSRELAKSKTGEINPSAKLTKETVKKIREERYLLGHTQQYLADKYKVGRATIADIVNYRTWVLKDDLSLRKYKTDVIVTIEDLTYSSETTIYDRLNKDYLLLNIPSEKISIYLEKLPIDRLLYLEVRDNDNKFIVNSDLFFPANNDRTACIVASFNPVKTGRCLAYRYMSLLNNIKF